MVQLINRYGSVFRLWMGPFRLSVVLSEPKYVEYFLNSNENINKSDGYNMVKSWLGEGLGTSNGIDLKITDYLLWVMILIRR